MENFSKMHLSETSNIQTSELPGIKSRALLQLQEEIEGNNVSYPKKMPIAIKKAKGAIIEDVDGNHFIDFFAGCGVLNVGHSNAEVLKSVQEQIENVIHVLDFPTKVKLDVIQEILAQLPPELKNEYKVSFGGPTGSDAIESAIKLAKIKTGRDTIISFTGGYHGMSAGALAITSDISFRNNISSLMPNVHFAPFNYPYRAKSNNYGKHFCLSYFENMLQNNHSGISKPAAIVVEPIQGEGGNIVPEKGYLEELVRIAHKYDVLVIFDEIQCGFFRTGEFLGFMHTKAIPDIITISKGLGGIGLPLSGIIYRKDIEAWSPGAHIGTFRGNQASLAAAKGAFDFVKKHNIKEHVKNMEVLLMEGLKTLQNKYAVIGDVRGKGLMIGVEIVKDLESKAPFPEFVAAFRKTCFNKGLLFEVGGHYDNVIRILPPLNITPKIIASALAIIDAAFEINYELFSCESIYNTEIPASV